MTEDVPPFYPSGGSDEGAPPGPPPFVPSYSDPVNELELTLGEIDAAEAVASAQSEYSNIVLYYATEGDKGYCGITCALKTRSDYWARNGRLVVQPFRAPAGYTREMMRSVETYVMKATQTLGPKGVNKIQSMAQFNRLGQVQPLWSRGAELTLQMKDGLVEWLQSLGVDVAADAEAAAAQAAEVGGAIDSELAPVAGLL